MPKDLDEMSMEELWQLFPILLTEHKNEWIEWYHEEYSNLNQIFGSRSRRRISHIGSTAIHKIWAKPTIDILFELQKENDMNEVKYILMNHGYGCMSEDKNRKSFQKGYTKYGFAERVFHLHLRFEGDNDELYFRDFMNDHPELADKYEKLKLSLWKKYEHNRDGYTDAKSAFIKKYTQQAKLIYGSRYDHLDL